MRRFSSLDVIGCADHNPESSTRLANDYSIHAYDTVDALLSDERIDIVVNITPPRAHFDTTVTALAASKHVYVEKPMATSLLLAKSVVSSAQRLGRTIGSAPDTFLGSAGQTARVALDAGLIGAPIGAVAFATHSRAESWHPNPGFLFAAGGGPVLDLGPYYVTALVNLLGPVARVNSAARIGAPTRRVTAPARRVDSVDVTVSTHSTATLEFVSGTIGTVVMSFDIWDHSLPFIELYGTEGTLRLPDPNEYDGPVRLRRHSDPAWITLKPVLEPKGVPGEAVQRLRGEGVADLAGAIHGDPLRVTPVLALHVLEVLEACETSAVNSSTINIQSKPPRPATQAGVLVRPQVDQ